MGGDRGPMAMITAANQVLQSNPNVRFILVGNSDEIERCICKMSTLRNASEILHSENHIHQSDGMLNAIRKHDSSMRIALRAIHNKEADAIVSGGNTGALMALAKLKLGTINGISRPSLMARFPNVERNKPVTVLDVGANVTCDEHELVNFAIMGHTYASSVLKRDNPSIKLLNIGQEDAKGSSVIQKAASVLRENCDLNFQGYIEPHNMLTERIDVVVCDGFSGNVLIKAYEGAMKYSVNAIRSGSKNPLALLGAFLLKPSLRNSLGRFHPKYHNGAVLIGVDGIVVKSHGGADAITCIGAIQTAIDATLGNITEMTKNAIAKIMSQEI